MTLTLPLNEDIIKIAMHCLKNKLDAVDALDMAELNLYEQPPVGTKWILYSAFENNGAKFTEFYRDF